MSSDNDSYDDYLDAPEIKNLLPDDETKQSEERRLMNSNVNSQIELIENKDEILLEQLKTIEAVEKDELRKSKIYEFFVFSNNLKLEVE